jgi:membrane-bound ClpP family serine protease
MRQPLTWIAVALMLTGAVMLVADVGVAGLWIAVITIGIALVAIDANRHRQGQHHV